MNKKLLIFGLPILLVGLVAAITFYAMFSVSFNVTPAITVDGDLVQTLDSVFSGETIRGTAITITNDAPSERVIILSDDSNEEIVVSYVSELTLAQKVVDFELDKWDPLSGGKTAVVEYTVIDDQFTAKVTSGDLTDYVLVYYKDNSDRFSSPATAIGTTEVTGNLPYEDDANADEYDYCETEEYVTCHGSKIWYVPSIAIDGGNINWGMASEFLFETELIQFNSDSELVMYPNQNLVLTPVYHISDHASGDYTITTQVA